MNSAWCDVIPVSSASKDGGTVSSKVSTPKPMRSFRAPSSGAERNTSLSQPTQGSVVKREKASEKKTAILRGGAEPQTNQQSSAKREGVARKPLTAAQRRTPAPSLRQGKEAHVCAANSAMRGSTQSSANSAKQEGRARTSVKVARQRVATPRRTANKGAAKRGAESTMKIERRFSTCSAERKSGGRQAMKAVRRGTSTLRGGEDKGSTLGAQTAMKSRQQLSANIAERKRVQCRPPNAAQRSGHTPPGEQDKGSTLGAKSAVKDSRRLSASSAERKRAGSRFTSAVQRRASTPRSIQDKGSTPGAESAMKNRRQSPRNGVAARRGSTPRSRQDKRPGTRCTESSMKNRRQSPTNSAERRGASFPRKGENRGSMRGAENAMKNSLQLPASSPEQRRSSTPRRGRDKGPATRGVKLHTNDRRQSSASTAELGSVDRQAATPDRRTASPQRRGQDEGREGPRTESTVKSGGRLSASSAEHAKVEGGPMKTARRKPLTRGAALGVQNKRPSSASTAELEGAARHTSQAARRRAGGVRRRVKRDLNTELDNDALHAALRRKRAAAAAGQRKRRAAKAALESGTASGQQGIKRCAGEAGESEAKMVKVNSGAKRAVIPGLDERALEEKKRESLVQKKRYVVSADGQVMTREVTVGGVEWLVEAKIAPSMYGQLYPMMRCVCGAKEYPSLQKLSEGVGEKIAMELWDVFSTLKDVLCSRFADAIEASKSAVNVRKRTRPDCVEVNEAPESDFLPSLLPCGFTSVDNSDKYGEVSMPPCPVSYDGRRHKIPYLSGTKVNHDMTVLNLGGYITSTSVLGDILAVGNQSHKLLLRIDTSTGPGPNAVHIVSLKTHKRIFSLCHDGKAVRKLQFVKNSQNDGRLGLLWILATTGHMDLFALPSDITDGSFIKISPVWSAPVGRATVDGAPKGLLSCHTFVANGILWILGGMRNGMINVWNVDDDAELAANSGGTFGHPARTFPITSCCWLETKDKQTKEPVLFATGDLNGLVCLWDRQDTLPMHQILVPGTGHVYIRDLQWGARDVASVYIRHQSVAVWNLTQNSIHDVRGKYACHGETVVSGFEVDADCTTSMGSLSVWSNGVALRGSGGCSWEGRQLLQSWSFRGRAPVPKPAIARPETQDGSDPNVTTVSKVDDRLRVFQAFLQTLRLIEGLKECNLSYLSRMRFWENDEAAGEDEFIEMHQEGIYELVDPVPLTSISISDTTKTPSGPMRTMIVGSAAGLLTIAPLPKYLPQGTRARKKKTMSA